MTSITASSIIMVWMINQLSVKSEKAREDMELEQKLLNFYPYPTKKSIPYKDVKGLEEMKYKQGFIHGYLYKERESEET